MVKGGFQNIHCNDIIVWDFMLTKISVRSLEIYRRIVFVLLYFNDRKTWQIAKTIGSTSFFDIDPTRHISHHDFHYASCDYYWDFLWPFFLLWTLRLCNYVVLVLQIRIFLDASALDIILNIGLNMLPYDSYISCLHCLLGYSPSEFQALQLAVRVSFGAVDSLLPTFILVYFLEISLKG